MAQAHAVVGGTARGRRYTTQQINRSYAVLLSSQFQGFCRDLHSECVDYLVNAVSPASLRSVIRVEFVQGRQLDRGNAQPASIGSDFGRLGVDFWSEVEVLHAKSTARKRSLENLNVWRNSIVHQNFDPGGLGGSTMLHLRRVRRWRTDCEGLARSFDEVMRRYLSGLIGVTPW